MKKTLNYLLFLVQTFALVSGTHPHSVPELEQSHRQLQSCTTGTYSSGTACFPCTTGCDVCTSTSDCSVCSTNYFKSGTTCSSCGLGCLSCSPITGCSGCRSGFILNVNTCVMCSQGCETCNLQGCVKCRIDYTLENKACTYDTTASSSGGGGGLSGGAIAGVVIGSLICLVIVVAMWICLKRKCFPDEDESKVGPANSNTSYSHNQSGMMGSAQPIGQHTDPYAPREPSPYMDGKRGMVSQTSPYHNQPSSARGQQGPGRQATRKNQGQGNQAQYQDQYESGQQGQGQNGANQRRNQPPQQQQKKNESSGAMEFINDVMFHI